MNSSYIVILCTVPNLETAQQISHLVVSEKLAACSNIVPDLKSIYLWENSVQKDAELLLIMKTRAELYDQIELKIRENHPYSIPEIIAIPIIKGNSHYLKWIDDNVKKR